MANDVNPVKHIGYVYTICFNVETAAVYPQDIFFIFIWLSEQTAIISIYSIHQLVFVTETQYAFCGIGAEFCSNM
jgi:hypothetical protein